MEREWKEGTFCVKKKAHKINPFSCELKNYEAYKIVTIFFFQLCI